MMKKLPITTYWTDDEARIVYEFLFELQDAIWSVYGEQMAEWYQAECRSDNNMHYDDDFAFDDDIPF